MTMSPVNTDKRQKETTREIESIKKTIEGLAKTK
jgi:hypothetical protein